MVYFPFVFISSLTFYCCPFLQSSSSASSFSSPSSSSSKHSYLLDYLTLLHQGYFFPTAYQNPASPQHSAIPMGSDWRLRMHLRHHWPCLAVGAGSCVHHCSRCGTRASFPLDCPSISAWKGLLISWKFSDATVECLKTCQSWLHLHLPKKYW